ncbi:ATP-binding protein [Bifidobacterium choloepi]|uniref:AAA family ATPase n=1 Tax=Bifidobacterium choloepi TaxID=2614131 RepID=A0A6I5MYD3_9BIFI|nr:ATP-binding protein [Bifidobacterium choloepi]NEG69196.1 AAA family ATPase [Bifidobacterium choloepi]
MDNSAQSPALINPFMPGAGLQPVELAGRNYELTLMRTLLGQISLGYQGVGMVFFGLRGVGKTVLLRRFAAMAEEAGMIVMQMEADGNAETESSVLREQVQRARKAVSSGETLAEAGRHIASVEVGLPLKLAVGFTADDTTESDPYSNLEKLAEALKGSNRGLFLFIDEFQQMNPDMMGRLITLQHTLGQEGLPFYIIAAGLPNLPGVLSESRSYAERLFRYRQLDNLSGEESRNVFQQTARQAGRSFTDEALDALQEYADGYPYAIQAFGSSAWDASSSTPMDRDAVANGLPEARELLDEGLYHSRWQRATPAGRRYMEALAAVGGDAASSAGVAAYLGKTSSQLSKTRAQLIEQGLIYMPLRGEVAFTVPGMGDYINRNHPPSSEPYDREHQ